MVWRCCGQGGVPDGLDGARQGAGHPDPQAPGYVQAQDRTALLNRMKRIQGQVRGITEMIEAGEYCIDVLTQITAAKRALEKVSLVLVDDHLRGCVRQAAASGDPSEIDQKLQEINTLLTRMLKT